MKLQEINAFIALAEELHFTRAAERLEVSQPQFSQLIRRLENRFDTALVERTTRRVALTTAGQAALPHARRAVQEINLMYRSAHDLKGHVQGTVRLGYAGASSRPSLPGIARAVRENSPGVDLHLRSMVYGAQGPGRVVSGDLDISFSRRPLVHSGLIDRVFEYEEVLVALPSDHRLATSGSIDLHDLRDDSWVMFPGTYGSNVRDVGLQLTTEAGYTPKIVQEAPDSYTILGLVAAGVGVTITVSSVAHVGNGDLVFLPLAGTPRFLTATVVWSAQAGQATLAVIDAINQTYPIPEEPEGIIVG
ncbi:LysR family transcriptional regulator [Enteractinococcus helveticum]|uniref:LysR family transcriptional regulator n=1 Tax=Enteractinococcus helveticum TaxID=1837282 RepID=UPI0005B9B92F|nr:LysR family transcriptional regulator [Enteractinococcus helveticum]